MVSLRGIKISPKKIQVIRPNPSSYFLNDLYVTSEFEARMKDNIKEQQANLNKVYILDNKNVLVNKKTIKEMKEEINRFYSDDNNIKGIGTYTNVLTNMMADNLDKKNVLYPDIRIDDIMVRHYEIERKINKLFVENDIQQENNVFYEKFEEKSKFFYDYRNYLHRTIENTVKPYDDAESDMRIIQFSIMDNVNKLNSEERLYNVHTGILQRISKDIFALRLITSKNYTTYHELGGIRLENKLLLTKAQYDGSLLISVPKSKNNSYCARVVRYFPNTENTKKWIHHYTSTFDSQHDNWHGIEVAQALTLGVASDVENAFRFHDNLKMAQYGPFDMNELKKDINKNRIVDRQFNEFGGIDLE
jgi:hypothetical protein